MIGAEPLIETIPLQQKGADQEVVTQFSMNTVEALGLLKMDFLGLRNLDVIDKAVELIGSVDMTAIPLDDKKTYAMLARGEGDGRLPVRVVRNARGAAAGEADGVRTRSRSSRSTARADAYIPNYAKRKAGQEQVAFIDPRLKAITGTTYGISIYQEQSMEIAKQIGGFSPAEADDLRKAIGKKIHKLMASLKDKFIAGCIANETSEQVARQLWDDIEVAGLLVQQVARGVLRADRLPHRLAEGEPSVRVHGGVSSVMSTKDRVPLYVNACDELGIEVLPPDVNTSQTDFAVVEEDPLRPERGQGGRKRPPARSWRPVTRAAVRVDLGLRRARRPAGREQALARGADQVRRARLDRRHPDGDARPARAGARVGQKHAADRLAGQASIFDLGGDEAATTSTIPRSPQASSRSRSS